MKRINNEILLKNREVESIKDEIRKLNKV